MCSSDLTRAETRLTSDGSSSVLNGALSWVYWEEIFDHEDAGYWWSDDGSAIALAPRSLDAFLAALRKAKSMDIRRVDGLGKSDESTARVSLAGAVAALLWMDERQGRVRGPDAMIARGTLAVKVPPAPQQPIVTRAKGRATQLRIKPPPSVAQAWKSACEDWEEALPDATAGYLLAPDMALWTFGCTRGAYNFSSKIGRAHV